MTGKRPAMGRGLSALLNDPSGEILTNPQKQKEILGSIAMLPLTRIEVNPFQPRTKFAKEQLEELAQSIRQLGIIQPLTVRRMEEGNFQLISGERRYRAALLSGIEEVPAYIRMANDTEVLEMALVENIQRQDLDSIEVALTYQRLIEECNLTQEEMSLRVGKDRSTVTNYLRLLKLPPIIQAGLRDDLISMGHARTLVSVEDEKKQLELYEQTIAKQLSVRQLEQMVRYVNADQKPLAANTLPFEMQRLREKLSERFETKVNIERNRYGRGKVVITFNSDHELERIRKMLDQ